LPEEIVTQAIHEKWSGGETVAESQFNRLRRSPRSRLSTRRIAEKQIDGNRRLTIGTATVDH
jgi:hypothetical protein